MDLTGGGDGGGAPTGCYKCGRPGHWSRDCPFFKKNAGSTTSTEKPKRVPKTRPKLTPDLLLSNNGLGQIFRHFPRAFKYRGRGHEVSDLGNLLGLYAEWHSRLLLNYSFDQFVNKVEQVGSTKRVKNCLHELRERVANGLDPAKSDQPLQQDISSHEQDARDSEEPNPHRQNIIMRDPDLDNLQENMLDEVWEKALEEPSEPPHDKSIGSGILSGGKEPQTSTPANAAPCSSGFVISDELRARMEANTLKALERAAARTQASH